jgi:1,4-alpha-glucan branching enzyme
MTVAVTTSRKYPIGAELIGENEVHFRVWAPKANQLDVALDARDRSRPTFHPLEAEADGYFSIRRPAFNLKGRMDLQL